MDSAVSLLITLRAGKPWIETTYLKYQRAAPTIRVQTPGVCDITSQLVLRLDIAN